MHVLMFSLTKFLTAALAIDNPTAEYKYSTYSYWQKRSGVSPRPYRG